MSNTDDKVKGPLDPLVSLQRAVMELEILPIEGAVNKADALSKGLSAALSWATTKKTMARLGISSDDIASAAEELGLKGIALPTPDTTPAPTGVTTPNNPPAPTHAKKSTT